MSKLYHKLGLLDRDIVRKCYTFWSHDVDIDILIRRVCHAPLLYSYIARGLL